MKEIWIPGPEDEDINDQITEESVEGSESEEESLQKIPRGQGTKSEVDFKIGWIHDDSKSVKNLRKVSSIMSDFGRRHKRKKKSDYMTELSSITDDSGTDVEKEDDDEDLPRKLLNII